MYIKPLDGLEIRGLVEIQNKQYSRYRSYRSYRLTSEGADEANTALAKIPNSGYLRTLSDWVRKQSFTSLIAAVYREFPAMKKNSVFRG